MYFGYILLVAAQEVPVGLQPLCGLAGYGKGERAVLWLYVFEQGGETCRLLAAEVKVYAPRAIAQRVERFFVGSGQVFYSDGRYICPVARLLPEVFVSLREYAREGLLAC